MSKANNFFHFTVLKTYINFDSKKYNANLQQ